MRPLILLSAALLLACGDETPLNPLAGTRDDRAIESWLAGKVFYYWATADHSEVVYYRFLEDGAYQFYYRDRKRAYLEEYGQWIIRNQMLIFHLSQGKKKDRFGITTATARDRIYDMTLVFASNRLKDAGLVWLDHRTTYYVVTQAEWEKILQAFFEEENGDA